MRTCCVVLRCWQVLCKPGSVTTHKKFEAEVYVLTKEEGGRHTPFMANYKPQFFLRTAGMLAGLLGLRAKGAGANRARVWW